MINKNRADKDYYTRKEQLKNIGILNSITFNNKNVGIIFLLNKNLVPTIYEK